MLCLYFSVAVNTSFCNPSVLFVQFSMDYFCFLPVRWMSSFIHMHHHGVGSPVVADVSSMFADCGVGTPSRFTNIYFIASAAGYATYSAIDVVFEWLSVSYYVLYLFIGCEKIHDIFSVLLTYLPITSKMLHGGNLRKLEVQDLIL